MPPYIGTIMPFAGNFAPAGWAKCDGSLLPIAENEALYALIGTTYGGDGQETFALPDLRGRVPLHQGQGRGLSINVIGEAGGVETVTLTTNQLPAHTHPVAANSGAGTSASPAGGVWAAGPANAYTASAAANTTMSGAAISASGGGQPHENMLPFLAVNFCIAVEGIYPSQS